MPNRILATGADAPQHRVDLGLETDAQMSRRLGYRTRAEVQAKQLAEEATARKEAEALEWERKQEMEDERVREEAERIENAIQESEYRELSQDEQTYLDYGEF